MEPDEQVSLLCHRCGEILTPGEGSFYFVQITAVADPTGPTITEADLAGDIEAEIEKLLAELRDRSEQELIDQVYRRLIIHLCASCYAEWIEDPAK